MRLKESSCVLKNLKASGTSGIQSFRFSSNEINQSRSRDRRCMPPPLTQRPGAYISKTAPSTTFRVAPSHENFHEGTLPHEHELELLQWTSQVFHSSNSAVHREGPLHSPARLARICGPATQETRRATRQPPLCQAPSSSTLRAAAKSTTHLLRA